MFFLIKFLKSCKVLFFLQILIIIAQTEELVL